MIETVEASGQLAVAFERLAIYLEKTDAIRRKVKSALVYPAILILISVLAISVFVFRIIPMFNDIYKGFDTQLPVFTLVVFTFSNFLRKNILLMLIFFAAIFFIIRRLINTKKGREIFDKMILKLPLLGSLLEFVIIERFANALGTLIKSGVPILSGLYIVGDSCGNKLYKDVIDTAAEEIKAGKAMCEPIEASGLFPPIVVQMIRVGEETGKMGEMLDRLAVYYQERITTKIDALMATFEPILLVCMGAIIGILVIAMYLPIFKIATVGTRQ
jgi:type IV pilus assembly protein PilC